MFHAHRVAYSSITPRPLSPCLPEMACLPPLPVFLRAQGCPQAPRKTRTVSRAAPMACDNPQQRQQQQWRRRRRRRQQRQCRLQAAADDGWDNGSNASEDGWADVLMDLVCEEGDWDAGDPHLQACVRRGSDLVCWLTEHCELGLQLALQLAVEQCRLEAWSGDGGWGGEQQGEQHGAGDAGSGGGSGNSSSSGSDGGNSDAGASSTISPLAAKLVFFRRLTSAEPGWASSLARVLADSDAALALPARDTEAALRFAGAQLQRVSRRRWVQLREPYSLPRLFLLHPQVGAALLGQHPGPFVRDTVPWLSTHLGWGDRQVADAAVSHHFGELCRLGQHPTDAHAALDWLCGPAGLSAQQASALLAPPGLRLLVAPPAQQAAEMARIERLALEWGVGLGLAAALVLGQPPLGASDAELTGQLVAILQGTVGMSEGQVLSFVEGAGLDGGPTRSAAALARATDRLKQLLLVYGSWPAVAAALTEQPEQLCMSWSGLESMLGQPQQRAAWRAVGTLLGGEEEQGQGGGGLGWALL